MATILAYMTTANWFGSWARAAIGGIRNQKKPPQKLQQQMENECNIYSFNIVSLYLTSVFFKLNLIYVWCVLRGRILTLKYISSALFTMDATAVTAAAEGFLQLDLSPPYAMARSFVF